MDRMDNNEKEKRPVINVQLTKKQEKYVILKAQSLQGKKAQVMRLALADFMEHNPINT